jgi:hypothetical protein
MLQHKRRPPCEKSGLASVGRFARPERVRDLQASTLDGRYCPTMFRPSDAFPRIAWTGALHLLNGFGGGHDQVANTGPPVSNPATVPAPVRALP